MLQLIVSYWFQRQALVKQQCKISRTCANSTLMSNTRHVTSKHHLYMSKRKNNMAVETCYTYIQCGLGFSDRCFIAHSLSTQPDMHSKRSIAIARHHLLPTGNYPPLCGIAHCSQRQRPVRDRYVQEGFTLRPRLARLIG